MKKLTNLLSFLTFFSLVILSSCKDKKEDPSPNPYSGPRPNLVFDSKDGYTTEDRFVVIYALKETVKIAWTATKNEKELKSFTVTMNGEPYEGFNNGLPYSIPTDQQDTYQDSIKYPVPYLDRGEQVKFVFTATDKDGITTSKTITLTAVIVMYGSENIFGAQNNTTYGPFSPYCTMNNYMLADAKDKYISLVYYYGTNSNATFTSPSDASAQEIYNDATYGLQTWTQKASTKFKLTTITAEQFDAIENELLIISAANSGEWKSSVTNLKVGDVVVYGGGPSANGLFKVTALTPGPNGSISIVQRAQYY